MDERSNIQDVITSYSDAVSRRDWELLASVFAPNATWENVGSFQQFKRDGVVSGIRSMVEPSNYLVQILGPSIIKIKGDTANARTLVEEHCDYDAGPIVPVKTRFHCLGLYTDVLKRVGGRWKFVERKFTIFNNDAITTT
jgi:ketosteroid isomerase-like protein